MHEILKKDIQYIKGVGPQKASLLKKMGLFTLKDIIEYIPFRYEDRSSIKKLSKDLLDNTALFFLKVLDVSYNPYSRLKTFKIRATDGKDFVNIIYFNQSFLKKVIFPGKSYFFYGKLTSEGLGYSLNSPDFSKEDDSENSKGILPVYELTKGITNKTYRKIVKNTLIELKTHKIFFNIPDYFIKKYDLIGLFESYKNIHFPENNKKLQKGINTLKTIELFFLTIAFGMLKNENAHLSDVIVEDKKKLNDFVIKLPFKLTNDQAKCIEILKNNFLNRKILNCLVQGDVGSGKTVVAMYLCLFMYLNGFKAIFMAPTEILAKQHYGTFCKMLENIAEDIILFKGGNYKGKKDHVKSFSEDRPLIIIGTHALFQKDVNFINTGAVIIDEQHRFGVLQRRQLCENAKCENVIVMTATPIPRTLAMTFYGDMESIIISEKPGGRKPIRTFVRGEKSLPDIYNFILNKIKDDQRCFIVTPLIEESEKLDLKAAQNVYDELSEHKDFKCIVGLVHGKLKQKEKDSIMERFIDGDIKVLISTTVIEVGVDVPNATIMLIKNAERFGVAQLHQLRGRVGRSDLASYCILVHSDNVGKQSLERLRLLERSNDGFKLAQEDMRFRGIGQFFGKRQHGFGDFKFVNPLTDGDLIQEVNTSINNYLNINGINTLDDSIIKYVKENYIKEFNIL